MGYEKALSLLRQGRANPSDYLVVMPGKVTRGAAGGGREFNEYISYFCRAATLPSSQNTVLGVMGHDHLGIKRNMVTGRNFGSPIVLTFTERSDLIVYRTLKGWIDSTVLNSEQEGNGARSLRVQYYDVAKCDIEIYKLEPIQTASSSINREEYAGSISSLDSGAMRGHKPTGRWTFINCIPLSIEQTTMSVEAADSLLDFTISISFESFKFEDLGNSSEVGALSTFLNRV